MRCIEGCKYCGDLTSLCAAFVKLLVTNRVFGMIYDLFAAPDATATQRCHLIGGYIFTPELASLASERRVPCALGGCEDLPRSHLAGGA